jgi:hypothetical protein
VTGAGKSSSSEGICLCWNKDTGEASVIEFVDWRECYVEIERELKSGGHDWECSYRRPRGDP